MQIGKYTLINEDKAERAINGTIGGKGQLIGGVGPEASDEAKIVEYDRIGGAIFLNVDKVKNGCFYDFKNKKPFETPEVLLEFRINDKVVTVPADEPLPPLVRAAKEAQNEEQATDDEDENPAPSMTTSPQRGKRRSQE